MSVTYTLTCEPETESYVGNCSAIDDETDRETEGWIRDQLAAGNEWAWCCARVTAECMGFTGAAYLGCCSYESEASFRECSYADLQETARADLMWKLGRAIKRGKRAAKALETLKP